MFFDNIVIAVCVCKIINEGIARGLIEYSYKRFQAALLVVAIVSDGIYFLPSS